MSDHDQAAAILAGIMSTFGECAELHPEKQLPMATFILDAIRAGKVPAVFPAYIHIDKWSDERDQLRAEMERKGELAHLMEQARDRQIERADKATAERDRLAGLLSESRRRLQGFYRNPPAMPIARDLLNRIDAALAEVRP